ncbi:MAG: hypothetical protein H6584_08175 [Flavobacteriales bacterium]|nr:hypothetical protein [Flavobacteriales bacterium]
MLVVRYRKLYQTDIALPTIFFFAAVILTVFVWQNPQYDYALFLFLFEQVKYHFSREDLLFLKRVDDSFYVKIILEYLITSILPLSILVLLQSHLLVLVYLILLVIVALLPQFNIGYAMPYPFSNKFPEWKIYFRKKHLWVPLLLAYVLVIPSVIYQNSNIIWFGFMVIVTGLSSIYMEREPIYFLKIVRTESKVFFREQMLNAFKNSFLLMLPYGVVSVLFFFEEWSITLGLTVGCCLLVQLALVLKYAFYSSQIVQALCLSLCLAAVFEPMLFILAVLMGGYSYRKCLLFLKNTIDA